MVKEKSIASGAGPAPFKKRIQRILACMTILILVFLLAGCDTPSETKAIARYEKQGAENALAHVKKKYGLDAEVLSCRVDRIPGGYGGEPTSNVVAKVAAGDEEFAVFVTGAEESDAGADSRQSEEIRQALFDAVNQGLPGLKKIFLLPNYFRIQSQPDEEDLMVYGPRYDGTNLYEVLEDGAGDFAACYVQTDLSDSETFRFMQDIMDAAKHQIEFVSYRNEELMEAATGFYAISDPMEAESVRNLTKDTYEAFELQTVGEDLLYCVRKDSKGIVPETTIEKTEDLDVSHFQHRASEMITALTDTYAITSEGETEIELYFPEESQRKKDAENRWSAWETIEADGKRDYTRYAYVNDGPGYSGITLHVQPGIIYHPLMLEIVEEEDTSSK